MRGGEMKEEKRGGGGENVIGEKGRGEKGREEEIRVEERMNRGRK